MPSEEKNYEEKSWFGQSRINYELVRVDRKLIDALNTLIKLLQADRSAHGLNKVDMTEFDSIMKEAADISSQVASIDPPGCTGPPPY